MHLGRCRGLSRGTELSPRTTQPRLARPVRRRRLQVLGRLWQPRVPSQIARTTTTPKGPSSAMCAGWRSKEALPTAASITALIAA